MAAIDKPGSTAGDALTADGGAHSRSQGAKGGTPADSPKPHGDKLGLGGKAEAASPDATPGDSPKPHGDPLKGKLTR